MTRVGAGPEAAAAEGKIDPPRGDERAAASSGDGEAGQRDRVGVVGVQEASAPPRARR